jgi:hypothetical protein
MTTTADIQPGHDEPSPSLDAQAASALSALFRASGTFAADLEEAGRADAHRQQERQRELAAQQVQNRAEQHAAALNARLDLADQRFAGFYLGALAVTALTVFDAIPLNWAAQAFGLPSAATWLVTLIMVAASAGAMAGLELTREDSRRRGALLLTIGIGYLALTVLRASYLVTVSGEGLVAAVLQAVLLSAISAGLVGCGSAVMARTRPLPLDRALAAVRRARAAAVTAQEARRRAEEKMQRHWTVLLRALREWSITAGAPAGVSQADWNAALERALRAVFGQ